MTSAVSSATQTQPVAQSAGTPPAKPAQSKPQSAKSSASADTVQLSATAQALLAAEQEAMETPAQTAKEAFGGDPQAQRLLAKEAAAAKSALK